MSEGRYTYDHPRPAVTTDVALFRRTGEGGWEILLVRRGRDPFAGSWALPGGFVDELEPLEAAAARELEEECGIRGVELWQFRAFGDPHRDPRGHTVSIAYLGIVSDSVNAAAADDAADARWFPLDHLPQLAFDHDEIVRAAVERLQEMTT